MVSTAMTNAELNARIMRILPHLGSGPVIGWDLDSTVRDTSHRRHIAHAIRAKAGEYTWDSYYMQCADDTPIEGSVALMRLLKGFGCSHIAISGSGEQAGELTRKWCVQYDVPFDVVMLRKDGDHTPNGTWKVRVVRALQRQGADVRLFFEDWGAVAEQVRAETGVPVVGINPFDSDELANLGQGL